MEKAPDTVDEEFEATFWPAYPRKVAKGTARKAFRAARKKVDLSVLMEGLAKFAKESAGKDAKFICHASTWLHGERWEDESRATRSGNDVDERLIGGLYHRTWVAIFRLYRSARRWHGPGGLPGTVGYVGPLDLLRSEEVAEMERAKAAERDGTSS